MPCPQQVDPDDNDSWFLLVFSPQGGSLAEARHRRTASNTYGGKVTRLLRWSEQQLCRHICDETVCSLLGLAHVYGSPELEHHCLRFVKANMAAVLQRPEFACLAPALLVKSSMFCAGVEAGDEPRRKRKIGGL